MELLYWPLFKLKIKQGVKSYSFDTYDKPGSNETVSFYLGRIYNKAGDSSRLPLIFSLPDKAAL